MICRCTSVDMIVTYGTNYFAALRTNYSLSNLFFLTFCCLKKLTQIEIDDTNCSLRIMLILFILYRTDHIN